MFRLDGKTAFVTGAGSGIGEATARALAAAGARVFVADRDAAGGQRVTGAIRESGGAAEYHSFDVTDEAACAAAAAHVGDVDVLVNNAGVGHVGTICRPRGPISIGSTASTCAACSTSARRSSAACSPAARARS